MGPIGLLWPLLPLGAALTCLTCIPTPDSTQLDKFRVTTRLSRPICPMEPVDCDRDQDSCVTVTMHIGGGEYWLGAGCDRRSSFPTISSSSSCQNIRTLARSVQLGYTHERRAMQRVCLCSSDLCNHSSSLPSSTSSLILIICPLLFLLLR